MKKIIAAIATASLLMGCAGSKAPEAKGGFKTVSTPATELQMMKKNLNEKGVLAEIGMGESNDEMVAMTMAQDEGRKQIAVSLSTEVTRLSDQYVQNVGGEAKKIWEEKTNQLTVQMLRGTTATKTVTTQNEEGTFKIYSLVVMDAAAFKDAINAIGNDNEELQLRVKSVDMQQRLDAAVEAYKSHVNGQ
jgi:hypothetical protein